MVILLGNDEMSIFSVCGRIKLWTPELSNRRKSYECGYCIIIIKWLWLVNSFFFNFKTAEMINMHNSMFLTPCMLYFWELHEIIKIFISSVYVTRLWIILFLTICVFPNISFIILKECFFFLLLLTLYAAVVGFGYVVLTM